MASTSMASLSYHHQGFDLSALLCHQQDLNLGTLTREFSGQRTNLIHLQSTHLSNNIHLRYPENSLVSVPTYSFQLIHKQIRSTLDTLQSVRNRGYSLVYILTHLFQHHGRRNCKISKYFGSERHIE